MSYKWHKSNKDGNDSEITSYFIAFGCLVKDATAMGEGFPDKIVAIRCIGGWVNVLVEVKNLDGKNRLGEKQKKFFDEWHGPKEIVRNFEDVKRVVAKYRLVDMTDILG